MNMRGERPVLPDDERHLAPVTGGYVRFGCLAWEPQRELDYGRQLPNGLWMLGKGRRSKRAKCTCRVPGNRAYVREEMPDFCPSCIRSGQDARIPTARQKPRESEETAEESSAPLTRREKRRVRFKATS